MAVNKFKKEETEFQKRMKQLGFDQQGIAYCLGLDVAEKIPQDLALIVHPTILAALSTKYNGQSINKIKTEITDQAMQILEDAKKYYDGDLEAMAKIYSKQIITNTNLTPRQKARLSVYVAHIKGLASYQQRHEVDILDEFERIEREEILEKAEPAPLFS